MRGRLTSVWGLVTPPVGSGATGGGLSEGPPRVHIHGRGQGYPSSHTCLSFPVETMGKASVCPAVAKPSVVWRMGLLPQWEPGAWSSLHQGDLSRGQGQWECHRLCPLHTSLRQAGGRQGKQPAFCQPVAPSSRVCWPQRRATRLRDALLAGGVGGALWPGTWLEHNPHCLPGTRGHRWPIPTRRGGS